MNNDITIDDIFEMAADKRMRALSVRLWNTSFFDQNENECLDALRIFAPDAFKPVADRYYNDFNEMFPPWTDDGDVVVLAGKDKAKAKRLFRVAARLADYLHWHGKEYGYDQV